MNPVAYAAVPENYTLSATSTDAAFPLVNLQDYFPDTLWKSNSTAQNQQIAIDFGVAKSCNFVLVAGHNFNSMGCSTIWLEGADDSGFTTNKVQVYDLAGSSTDPLLVGFAATSKRYWRFVFAKGSALSAVPQLGTWFLGTSFAFGSAPEYPFRMADSQYQTTEATALDGRIRTAQTFAGRAIYEMEFKLQNDTVRAAFQTFISTVRGKLRPFYLTNPVTGALWYVMLNTDFAPMDIQNYQLNNIVKLQFKSPTVS